MFNFKKLCKVVADFNLVKYRNTPPALSRTLLLVRGGLVRSVPHFDAKLCKIIIGFAVFVIIVFLKACSVTPVNKPIPLSNEPVASLDRQLATDAFQGGMAEIELGKQALQRSTNPKVKKFAQQMIEQHTKAQEKLLRLLNKKEIVPPKTSGLKYETVGAHLIQLSGSRFDELYMKEMGVNRHLEAIATFQREVTLGKDPDFKAFASEGLQTARNHFEMAGTVTGYSLLDKTINKG
ncbi:DUF4142 domain-containing protein [Scytonema hofmannii]|nr:DUF4142 domain-containing protein [Scytonema hofmannii]